jgi:glycosyltransferase involved in cell wall biosynthesis
MTPSSGAVNGGRLRILIVAHAFPPMNSIASHRPYSWAKEWRDLGHEIHVLTPAKHAFDGSMDLERDLAGIQLHEVPYLPFRRSSAVPGGSATPGVVRRMDWLKTLSRPLRFSLATFGDPRWLAYWPMLRRGLDVVRRNRLELIIATAPPEVLLLVARALSRRSRVPWVADYRDLWFREMRLHQSWLASRASGPLNRRLVRGASALVTVSQGLQNRLADYLQREVLVSYNGYFEEEIEATTPERPWRDGRIHIVYAGRVYPKKRNPEPLFRALSALKRAHPESASKLCVDFYGFHDFWLQSIIDKHGIRDQVACHGFVPYRQSLDAQRSADVLLFLDWMEASAEGVLTGKLFEYLASGRPILSLGPRKDSEAARLIAEANCGVTLTSHDEVVAYLVELLRSGRRESVPSRTRLDFSRERQARLLLEALTARVLAPRPGNRTPVQPESDHSCSSG